MAEHELIYTSLAASPMDATALTELLLQSREKNLRLDITGLLIYGRREFMQLLEGEKSVIFSLYDTIVRDERHRQVELLWEGVIDGRSLRNWSMGFVNADQVDSESLPAYSRYLHDGVSSLHLTGNKSVGRDLLLSMRDYFL